jgi:2-hydroxy-3-oxopropionate reductase
MTRYIRTRSSSIPLSLDSLSIRHRHHNLLTAHYSGLTIQERPHILRRLKAQRRLNHLLSALYLPEYLPESIWLIFMCHEEGAKEANSSREVAEQCDSVITMLPTDADVEDVIIGSEGILQSAHAGLLVIDMSTISPLTVTSLAQKLAQKGVSLLDAPVSGGVAGAQEAALSIMVGGDEEDFQRAYSLFSALGKTITYCGPGGTGQIVKACNQVLVALIIEAISESLLLGSKAGVAPDIILKVLSGGLAQNRFMDLRGQAMIQHAFEPGGKARFHLKDLRIAQQIAQKYDVVLPVGTLVEQLFTSLVASGGGDLDHSALLTVIEQLSHHSLH